jgi:hypothetical protein
MKITKYTSINFINLDKEIEFDTLDKLAIFNSRLYHNIFKALS